MSICQGFLLMSCQEGFCVNVASSLLIRDFALDSVHTCTHSLTVGESGRVVVDIDQCDVDCGGTGQTPQLTQHVFSLNDHLVVFADFTLHVRQSSPDDP